MRNALRLCKVLVLLCCVNPLWAQEEDYREPQGLNNWYIEAGGPAVLWSANYEKYLYRTYSNKYTWCAHVGAGFNPFNFNILNAAYLDKNTFLFPFSTSLLKGDGKEKLEIGTGFTLVTQNFTKNELYPHAVIGFRVMEQNGVCFRVNYVPLWRPDGFVHWLGISLGKNFSFK